MKKTAAVTMLAVAVIAGISGCASASAGPVATKYGAVDYTPASNSDPLVQDVHAAWVGSKLPTAYWITTEATLICKQANGGAEPRVHLYGPNAEANSAVLIGPIALPMMPDDDEVAVFEHRDFRLPLMTVRIRIDLNPFAHFIADGVEPLDE